SFLVVFVIYSSSLSTSPSFFSNDTPPSDIYTLSLHDALPILQKILRFLYQYIVQMKLDNLQTAFKQWLITYKNQMRQENNSSMMSLMTFKHRYKTLKGMPI